MKATNLVLLEEKESNYIEQSVLKALFAVNEIQELRVEVFSTS